MLQDQRRWTALLLIALVVLVAAIVLMGDTGLVAAREARAATYTVQAGDSLRSIAAQFGVSPEALAKANGLPYLQNLRRGQELTIPDASMASEPMAPADMETAAPTEEPMAEPTAEATMAAMDEPAMPPDAATYTVQAGDSLSSIARAFGVTVEELIAANGLRTSAYLYPGPGFDHPRRGHGKRADGPRRQDRTDRAAASFHLYRESRRYAVERGGHLRHYGRRVDRSQ